MLQVLLMLFFALAAFAPLNARAESLQGLEPLISHATRLVVFSPHPDDESLGAGGLIQRVLKAGGKVKVIFITSGDGFPEGVEEEDHISNPTAKDYRKYGVERREEALKATATLGMKEHDVIFLGFPDAGLSYLRSKFLAHPYKSPFTEENRPPISEDIIPHTDYTGQDLTREIERVILTFDLTWWRPPRLRTSTRTIIRLTFLLRRHWDIGIRNIQTLNPRYLLS